MLRAEFVKVDFALAYADLPGGDHGMGGAYGERRMRDFFVRNLLATEPPNRNSTTDSETGG